MRLLLSFRGTSVAVRAAVKDCRKRDSLSDFSACDHVSSSVLL